MYFKVCRLVGALGNVEEVLEPGGHPRECTTRSVAYCAPWGAYYKVCRPVDTLGNMMHCPLGKLEFILKLIFVTFSGQAKLGCPHGEDEDDND